MAEALGALLEASLDPRRNKEGESIYSIPWNKMQHV